MKRRYSALAIAAGLLLAAGCGGDDDEADSATAETETTSAPDDASATSQEPAPTSEPTSEGTSAPPTTEEPSSEPSEPAGDVATTLRGRYAADPLNLDPIYIGNTGDYVNSFLVFEGLVQLDPDGEGVVNVLAETYEVSEDGLAINFTLRPGMQFHDGYGEVTAEDVKFSIERAAGIIPSEVEPFFTSYYEAIERVDVIDEYNGTIVLSEPSAVLTEQAIPQTHVISQAAFEELGADGFATHPVGTGPYEFDEAVAGQHVRYVRFEDYSGGQSYVPEQTFEEIVFNIIPDDAAAELAYEAGDLDILVDIRIPSVSRFEGFDDTTVTQGTSRGYRWIGMNVLDPALQNETLRQAVIAAIDVPTIVEVTSEGLETRATALLAPTAPIGYWADAPVQEQDLDLARSLVEQVPEADRTLTFTVPNDEVSRTVAQIAEENLEEAGLTIEIVVEDVGTFFTTGEQNQQRQLFYVEFEADFREPSLGFLWFTCDQLDVWNYMYWCSETYDTLLDEAQRTVDEQARGQIYIDMQKDMAEGLSSIWISHPTVFTAARTDTVQVLSDPSGTVFWSGLVPV